VSLAGCCADHHDGPTGQVVDETRWRVWPASTADTASTHRGVGIGAGQKTTGGNKTIGFGDKELRSAKLREVSK